MKLKKTQLFNLAIKLTKPFAVLKASMRCKLREASVSSFFRAGNCAVVANIKTDRVRTVVFN